MVPEISLKFNFLSYTDLKFMTAYMFSGLHYIFLYVPATIPKSSKNNFRFLISVCLNEIVMKIIVSSKLPF
jgi:hypothetical protein